MSMKTSLHEGILSFCNHPHLAAIISGWGNVCSNGIGAWCPVTLCQGTAGAEILPEIHGQKFAGANKSGQLSILVLAQKHKWRQDIYYRLNMQAHRSLRKDWMHCLTPMSPQSGATFLSEGLTVLDFVCLPARNQILVKAGARLAGMPGAMASS